MDLKTSNTSCMASTSNLNINHTPKDSDCTLTELPTTDYVVEILPNVKIKIGDYETTGEQIMRKLKFIDRLIQEKYPEEMI